MKLFTRYVTIFMLAPFFTMTANANTACMDMAENAGADNPAAYLISLFDYLRGNEEYCETVLFANVESPAEVYSDAIVFQSWPYCVKEFGGTKTGPFYDWERLGLTNNEVGDKEGKDLWPYNRSIHKGSRWRRNKAAARVSRAAGDYTWIGSHLPAIAAMFEYTAMFGGSNKKEAVSDFFSETTSGSTYDVFENLKNAFKVGLSHPTKLLKTGKCKTMMDICKVPQDKQEEFMEHATALSAVGTD